MKFKTLTAAASLFMMDTALAGDETKGKYDYTERGANWNNFNSNGADWSACTGPNQSPIDLSYSFPVENATADGFQKHYENLGHGLQSSAALKWLRKKSTIQVDFAYTPSGTMGVKNGITLKDENNTALLNDDKTVKTWSTFFSGNNFFQSGYGKNNLGTFDRFVAHQFHFHAGSEHTIDGQQFDFEMHIVHYPEQPTNGYIGAVLGFIFDTENYDESVTPEQTEVIDRFFESLRFDALNHLENGYEVPKDVEIPLGEMIDSLETRERFVYSGSLTTPPCSTLIYWNVVTKVLPMNPKHLRYFQEALKFSYDPQGQGNEHNGNFREVQSIDRHAPRILRLEPPEDEESERVATVVIIALITCFTVLGGWFLIYCSNSIEMSQQKQTKRIVEQNDGESVPLGQDKFEGKPF